MNDINVTFEMFWRNRILSTPLQYFGNMMKKEKVFDFSLFYITKLKKYKQ